MLLNIVLLMIGALFLFYGIKQKLKFRIIIGVRIACISGYCRDYLDYIYVNEIGEIIKPGYLTTHFPAILEAHNMPRIRFHDLRHSCASLLFAQGVSMKEIQASLGHSTIGTTANIYTHLAENSKLASANAIISILQKK